LSGSGYGDLAFHNGALDEIFLVRNQEAGAPQLITVSNSISFESMELTIHSYSVDWLYQALLYIFKGVIKAQIEGALDSALHTVSGWGVQEDGGCCVYYWLGQGSGG
jgi:hypothetical protein